MKLSNNNIIWLYLFTYVLVSGFLLIGYSESETKLAVGAQKTFGNQKAFDDLLIEARSAVVFDLAQNKFLYSKNPKEALPLASLAKLMTALVADKEGERGGEEVLVSSDAISEEGDNGLKSGERWTVRSLSDFALMASSNDAAAALALGFKDTPFVYSMNEKAKKLGLDQTTFSNATGLDLDETASGARSSAIDITKLLAYILKYRPEIVEMTRKSDTSFYSLDNIEHKVRNTNPSIASLSGALASKTGYTDLAGGNLVVAFEIGPLRPIILTVLGSSLDGRFRDMQKLVEAARNYYDN